MNPVSGVCRLREADEGLTARVYAASHAQWGAGLSATAYRDMWRELAELPWARSRFRLLVWTDGDRRVLSSVKVYRPRVRIDRSRGDACGIGAVFTPPAHRRRGYAKAMLRRVLADAAARGDSIALLFSDISPELYESLGFRSLPAEEAVGTLRRAEACAPPELRLRPLVDDDLPEVQAAHAATAERRTFAVERDLEHWRFLLARSEAYARRLGGPGAGRSFQVAESNRGFVGYVIGVESGATWELREVGAAGGEASLAADIARAAARQARRAGMRAVRGWFPRPFGERLPEWDLRFEPRGHARPMILPLRAGAEVQEAVSTGRIFIPYLDQF